MTVTSIYNQELLGADYQAPTLVFKQGILKDTLTPCSFDLSRYLPVIGRFLIVVTFIEDSLRILTQWSDQLVYLRDFRHSKIP